MAVSKLTGTAWGDISEVSGVLTGAIDNVTGIAAPAGSGVVSGAWVDIRPWDPASDSGSGNITNLGSLGKTFTVTGATRTTKGGYEAWYVDGVNDHIRATVDDTDVSSFGQSYTVESWFHRMPQPSSSQLRPQVVLSISDSNYEMMRHSISSSAPSFSTPNRLSFSQEYTGSGTTFNTQSHIDASAAYEEWYHLVTTVDGSAGTVRQYINGSTVSTTTGLTIQDIFGQVTTANNMYVSIGLWDRSSISDDYQEGYHGGLRIYNSALTNAEVQQNYDATKSNYGL